LPGYALGVDLFSAARHSQIRSVELICRQAGKGMTRVGKKCEIGKGNAASAIALRADAHQLSRIFVSQRPEQNGIRDGKNRRICANSQREGGHGERGECRRPGQHSQAVAQVSCQCFHGSSLFAELTERSILPQDGSAIPTRRTVAAK
jgi:hypothetical protein